MPPAQQQSASGNDITTNMKRPMGRITAVHSRFHSADVRIKEDLDFSSLISSPLLLRGLTAAGYQRPSPIQLKAIPLGRLGLDIVAQAKSGTGKTIVFSVIAIETALGRPSSSLVPTMDLYTKKRSGGENNKVPQVIILAPTREIAVQITEVIQALVSEGLQGDVICHPFIGGLPVKEDKKRLLNCSIVVGTPGRVRQLVESGDLKTSQLKLLVLDEADKLMEEGFQEDVTVIAERVAKGSKGGGGGKTQQNQVMAFSATYDDQLLAALDKIVKNNPQHIMLCPDQRAPELAGVMQYYKIVHPLADNKLAAAAASAFLKQARIFDVKRQALRCLLEQVPFHQAFVFLNHHGRALDLVKYLNRRGWPALFIASAMTQEERLQVMAKARNFELRVLVCTDLIARGIDIERVNLVVSLDVPRDAETYFHRIGRTGRFGTKGLAVGIVDDQEAEILQGWQEDYGLHLQEIVSEQSDHDEPMEGDGKGLANGSSRSLEYDFGFLNRQTQSQHHERPLQNEEDLTQFEKLEALRQHAAENNIEEDEDDELIGDEVEEDVHEQEDRSEQENEESWHSYYGAHPDMEASPQEQNAAWGWPLNNETYCTGNRTSNNSMYQYYPAQTYHSSMWHPYHVYYDHHFVLQPPPLQQSLSLSHPNIYSSASTFIPPDLPF